MSLKLNPVQKEVMRSFLAEDCPYILQAGSVRSGKTAISAICLSVHQNRYYPLGGGQYFLGGYTVGSVFNNIAPYFKELSEYYNWAYREIRSSIDPKLVINGNDFNIYGAHDKRSQNRIQGLNAVAGALDELGLMDEGFYQQAMNRASRQHMKVLMTMNKQSPVHWTKGLYDNVQEHGIKLFESTMEDNKEFLPNELPDQLKAIKKNTHWYSWHIDNKWAIPEGLIYPDLAPIEKPKGRPTGNRVVAVDWGLEGVTAGLLFEEYASGTIRNWFISDEYHHDGRKQGPLLERNHMHRIVARFGVTQQTKVILDPSARSLYKEFADAGYWVVNAINDVLKGIETTGRAIREKLIGVSTKCAHTIEESLQYAWNPVTSKPVKADDHHMDAMRYGTMDVNPITALQSWDQNALDW